MCVTRNVAGRVTHSKVPKISEDQPQQYRDVHIISFTLPVYDTTICCERHTALDASLHGESSPPSSKTRKSLRKHRKCYQTNWKPLRKNVWPSINLLTKHLQSKLGKRHPLPLSKSSNSKHPGHKSRLARNRLSHEGSKKRCAHKIELIEYMCFLTYSKIRCLVRK